MKGSEARSGRAASSMHASQVSLCRRAAKLEWRRHLLSPREILAWGPHGPRVKSKAAERQAFDFLPAGFTSAEQFQFELVKN